MPTSGRRYPPPSCPRSRRRSPHVLTASAQQPDCGNEARSCVPSPVSQRRRRPITCPVTAAGPADPGQGRPPTPGGSGSAGCPAVRSGAGRAKTGRGNLVTAARGLGPWLETVVTKGQWAASPRLGAHYFRPWSWRLRKRPGSRRKHTLQTPPGWPPGSALEPPPSGGAAERSSGIAKLSEITEAGRIGASFSRAKGRFRSEVVKCVTSFRFKISEVLLH